MENLLRLSFLLVWAFLGANAVFTLQNNCRDTVWPGILTGDNGAQLNNGGFELQPGQTMTINPPTGWSGRIWARTGCNFDQSGRGSCATGDCGNVLQCNGAGGTPPVSLAEFTLNTPTGDNYDVSLVDGYNVAVSIAPSGGTGNCTQVRCVSDVNPVCPQDLIVRGANGATVACRSSCQAFGRPEDCCTGEYNDPNVCQPSSSAQVFKRACPTAYTYAYDDPSSLFTCTGADYTIGFC